MRVLVAPNALKGTLTALQAARAIAEGVLRADATSQVVELPVADGGDGTREVLCAAAGGQNHRAQARDALGRPVLATWSALPDGAAVVDVASASGLGRLAAGERDVLRASSFGTGELIRAALDAGHRRIIVGVGGSASVDGGAGLLSALGVRFLSASGALIPEGARGLLQLSQIDVSQLHPALAASELLVACDVQSPLLGPEGAAAVYGPQKGATPAQVTELESALQQYAAVLARTFSVDVRQLAMAGAAGGIAAGLHAALRAQLASGIDLVLDRLGFDEQVRGADLTITAEGRFDRQSLHGKAPSGVADRARRAGVPTLILAGSIAAETPAEAFQQFAGAFSILREPVTLDRALATAAEGLASTAEQVTRLFLAARSR